MTGLDLALDAVDAVDRRPQWILIAGPNGAGKSTTAMALAGDRHQVRRIVNPDVIAGGLSGAPELSAVEACRIALRTQERYIAERLDFALETTLSGRRWDKVLDRLDNAHYLTTLYYTLARHPGSCRGARSHPRDEGRALGRRRRSQATLWGRPCELVGRGLAAR